MVAAATQELLDAMSSHVALLDPTGTIVAVNAAWRRFAEANKADGVVDPHDGTGLGTSYVEVCRRSEGPFSEGAADVAAGLDAVLRKERSRYDLDYPCPAPGVPRWFRLRAIALSTGGALIEHLDVTERTMSTAMVVAQGHILEAVATGRPLEEILEQVVDLVESQLPGTRCSILRVERGSGRMRFAAGRHLPAVYNQAVDGAPMGPRAGSCGTAAYRKAPVDVADIATDPLWDDYRHLALPHGLRACFSFPVLASGDVAGIPKGEVLATFAIYHQRPRSPADPMTTGLPGSLGLAGVAAAHLVGVALERNLAEAALRSSEAERDRLWSHSPDPVFIADLEAAAVEVNAEWTRRFGWTNDELRGRRVAELVHPDDVPATTEAFARLRKGQPLRGFEHRFRCRDGQYRWLSWNALPLVEVGRLYGFVRDVTDERRLQEQLQQTQKLEAIGQLAGGVAHDFNNLLTIILGNVSALEPAIAPDGPYRERLHEIEVASERASALTRQLLAFSRRSIVELRTVDLDGAVASVSRMLRRIIGEDIELDLALGAGVPVRIDPGQLEQVLMNLVLNARDAMPHGGPLRIATSTVVLDETSPATSTDALAPGRYAVLEVVDRGVGIDPAVIGRVFEPFFTTKGVGAGTGLGLATVYGIVRQAEGLVTVASELRRGSTFKVYLPAASAIVPERAPPGPTAAAHGHETILLAEDEPGVRRLASRVLASQGYRVLAATDGADALRIATAHDGPIDLVVTDVVMPEMGGRALVEALRLQRPELRVLYMSGYTDDAVLRHGIERSSDPFLPKPFTPNVLVQKVRELLDEHAR